MNEPAESRIAPQTSSQDVSDATQAADSRAPSASDESVRDDVEYAPMYYI